MPTRQENIVSKETRQQLLDNMIHQFSDELDLRAMRTKQAYRHDLELIASTSYNEGVSDGLERTTGQAVEEE